MDSQDAFTKISKPEDREKLLWDLSAARGEILCKGTTDHILKLKAYKLEKDKLHCLISGDSVRPTFTHENVIASFHLGGEKYFFQAVAEYDRGEIFFVAAFDLFHLQRRQNYRVKIPESYKAHLDIVTVNDQPMHLVGSLYDISSGGCRVVYQMDAPLIKMDDNLKAKVYVGKKAPIEVEAVVRHVKPDPTRKNGQVFGLEFKPLSPALEARMFGITMDLHRELFSKFS